VLLGEWFPVFRKFVVLSSSGQEVFVDCLHLKMERLQSSEMSETTDSVTQHRFPET
jgi:hypothetical protein